MEAKKSNKADLESKKVIFTQLGLIVALAVILLAFEWKSYDKSIEGFGERVVDNIEEDIIPITEQKVKPPPPPPPKKVVQLNIVEDDVEVEDDLLIDIEADEFTEIDEYIPIEVEEEVYEENIFTVVESMPVFKGGNAALNPYLSANIKYPVMAKESGIQGKVYITFVVEKDGSITDVKLLRGIGGGCDEEAIRVVKNMPKWTPGKQRGKPVRVQYNLPVRFTLH
jgi:protein TonB